MRILSTWAVHKARLNRMFAPYGLYVFRQVVESGGRQATRTILSTTPDIASVKRHCGGR